MSNESDWPIYEFTQSRGKLTRIHRPLVMGILNVTPDSFFDGGQYNILEYAVDRADEMVEEGVDVIDIGGMSTRPGAEEIDVREECRRVIPAIRTIRTEFPDLLLSVDTVHAEVVRRAADAGIDWINDISAGRMDEEMLSAVAEVELPYVLMHMQGRPEDMQEDPNYDQVVREVLDFFVQKLEKLHELGIEDIIIDPGFGFGKSVDHNYELLRSLNVFRQFERPLLVGLSRKAMVNKVLGVSPDEALHGTGVLHFAALQQGAHILRVHDVREARQVIQLFEKYSQ